METHVIHNSQTNKKNVYLELGLELLDEADACPGVGRDVDAREAQLAGVLRGSQEEVVLFTHHTPHITHHGGKQINI